MLRNEVLDLIAELVQSETEVVHQVNSKRGLTKKASKRERVAINAILHAICPLETPVSDEEFQQMN